MLLHYFPNKDNIKIGQSVGGKFSFFSSTISLFDYSNRLQVIIDVLSSGHTLGVANMTGLIDGRSKFVDKFNL